MFYFIILCLPLKGLTEEDTSIRANLNDTSNFAQRIMNINVHEQVIKEEFLFFTDTSSSKYNHLINKANQQLANRDIKGGLNTIQRVPLYAVPENDLPSYWRTATLAAYLNGETDNALSIVKQYELYDSSHLAMDTSIQLLKCLIFLEQDNYNQLASEFKSFKTRLSISESKTIIIDSLIKVGQQLKLKSAKKAALLSAIIPGSGQIYLKHTEEGLVNFALNLTTLSFTAFCIYKGYYATGVLIGYTLFQRFYTGGLRRTEKLTEDYNNALTIPLKQNLKERLIRLNLQNK